MKKTKRFAEGGRGRSAYQGNEDSYRSPSSMDEEKPMAASRDFDSDMDEVNYAAPSRSRSDESAISKVEESSARPMPTRPGQDRSGMATPTRPGQNTSGMAPIAAPRRPMASSNDLAESRAIRNAVAKSEAESGRAKVREQDARMSVPSEPVDETKLPLSERIKLSRERAGKGSGPTDTRSVNERFKSLFGMKKGGAVKMASGGSVSSASRRADGIAQKGKTRGKMC